MSRSRGVKALFERMDADGSKQIDCEELRRALGEDKVSNEVIEMLFQKYDKNKDGYLNEKEIKKFFKENSLYLEICNENLMPICRKPAQPKGGVKGLFERIDKDGSNKIDCQELRAALGEDNVSSQLVRKLFEEYDTNHDGYLDLKEIKKFFKENKIYSDLCAENLK
nr:centrin protein [Hymenolepis microstoma]